MMSNGTTAAEMAYEDENRLCIKDKFTCDGYDPPRAWVFSLSQKKDLGSGLPPDQATETSFLPLINHENDFSEWQWTDSELGTGSLSLVAPSSPWAAETDRNFCQYFRSQFAPMLSTTAQWEYFWHSTVPQAAWSDSSINHAMVAVAATFESRKSGVDRTELILQRSNLAIQAFTAQQASTDIGLIMCRLFSSMAQCKGDFRTATMHMNSGQKILQEATRARKAKSSDILRLMAPTLLALSTYTIDDSDFVTRISPDKWESFRILKSIHLEYGRLLRSFTSTHWDRATPDTNSLLSIAWSTLTQAFSSTLHPDVISFAEDPVVHVAQIIPTLQAEEALLSIDELDAGFRSLIRDLQYHFYTADGEASLSQAMRRRMRQLVENYVVQAAEVEPRMTAGTFWHEYDFPHCCIDSHLSKCELGESKPYETHFGNREVLDFERKKRDFYVEHVCQYRSGFMPT
ncbi:hypothetical protein LTR99_000988 [Exophiala xenobiotica]|uniref:Uncharacterized protein n=1 Tax=Vermiconidia calcicola TaxID=1690605 RepID=A0AAV9QK64_9PEZI|nr:hypothetical protein LTR96_003680 [Exophiala xenobiotica]KAK5540667.1 hypothetical protein LTR23_005898 [Chaetothyriales sp. CCFEE 6169]KAK5545551.1 hypothetical protein LTR25_000558 [Vermiconidia calcicola]KAK5308016.1 hypothetical protein LTR99_000988 [Exophiala xenobiotica]KAK5343086.1 hypothetical protein LTR98_000715 [Exophiala xenobiotica]